jgi:hypothetical protein
MNQKGVFSRKRKNDSDAAPEENWCHYSGLPSPSAYQECADYDGMGDSSRFPKIQKKKQ